MRKALLAGRLLFLAHFDGVASTTDFLNTPSKR
jgi:hypothetical protein